MYVVSPFPSHWVITAKKKTKICLMTGETRLRISHCDLTTNDEENQLPKVLKFYINLFLMLID